MTPREVRATDDAGARAPARSARATVIGTFGVVAAFAGIEHGIGAILQGSRSPDGLVFASWPDVQAFEIVAGEPALTLIPNLAVSGALAIALSAALGVWALGFGGRSRLGSFGLIGLSLGMLMMGAGFGPPLIGLILGLVGLRTGRTAGPRPRPVGTRFARWWRPLMVFGVLAYLSLVPGLVALAHLGADIDDSVVPVISLAAFAGLILSLTAAAASDAVPNDRLPVRAAA